MKFSEINGKSEQELTEMLSKAQVRLGELRFKLTSNALKDHSQIGKIKKEIARILTAINGHCKGEKTAVKT